MKNQSIVSFSKVIKSFNNGTNEVQILTDISFNISQGEYVCIEGPSGSGKSTLLSLMGLMDSPNSGELNLFGIATGDLSKRNKSQLRNEKIGFIFQAFNLISELTVTENISLPLRYTGKAKTKEDEQWINNLIERVGLEKNSDYFPYQLSGGQQQRVAFARALCNRPELILADEPTGNLDSKNGESIMNLINTANQEGSTIVLVTHDSHYSNIATNSIKLLDGSIIV